MLLSQRGLGPRPRSHGKGKLWLRPDAPEERMSSGAETAGQREVGQWMRAQGGFGVCSCSAGRASELSSSQQVWAPIAMAGLAERNLPWDGTRLP